MDDNQIMTIKIFVPIIAVCIVFGLAMHYANLTVDEQIEYYKKKGIERDNKITETFNNLDTCESKFIHLMRSDDKIWNSGTKDMLYDQYEQECLK